MITVTITNTFNGKSATKQFTTQAEAGAFILALAQEYGHFEATYVEG